MLVSSRWLKDYVAYDIDERQLAEKLTMAGAAVETIEYLGEKLENIVTGRVLSVAQHPDADNVRVCSVDIGQKELSIVCGAPNVAPGQIVPVALPGANLPNGMVIKEVKMRGVASQGMICSEAEVGLGDDASGIIVLPSDLPLGKQITELLPYKDTVLELEIYPNRPDLLSMIGIAREVAALTDTTFQIPQPIVQESGQSINEYVRIRVEDSSLCPRYSARILTNCKIGLSPLWMQRRLIAAGMRPINNIVDITNYVMLETGQPLHAFDYDNLEDKTLIIRAAHQDEKMVTLDETQRSLMEDDLVIADGHKPVCIAGVMGGENSEVNEDTTTILLESANFNPISIRRTSRRLGLRSEASSRFEKGLDPNNTILGLQRATELLAELANCQVAPGIIDVYDRPKQALRFTMRPQRVNEQLGTQIPAGQMALLLEKLELQVEEVAGEFRVLVPTFRGDIQGERDLVEEIARMYGYEKINPTLLTGKTTKGGSNRQARLIDGLRDWLVGLGFMEVINYSFISRKGLEKLRLADDDPLQRVIPLRNPLTVEQSVMRTTLTPGLLDVASHNVAHGVDNLAIFEIGSVFLPKELPITQQPEEITTLGLAMMGSSFQRSWGDSKRAFDFYDLKGVLESLLEIFGVTLEMESSEHPGLHPGRQAAIKVKGNQVGIFGEVHPQVRSSWEIEDRIFLAEIDLTNVLEQKGQTNKYEQLPRFPGMRRDLALLVPEDVAAYNIPLVFHDIGGDLIKQVNLFDVYTGKQVPSGYKSLAYTISFQASDRTLTDAEITTLLEKIEDTLQKRFAITRRA